MTDTALLVIDVQESFKHRPYWSEKNLPNFQAKLLQLIETAHQHNWQVVYILHEEETGAFSQASGFVQLMDLLQPTADEPIFIKHVHNALTESGLQAWLQQRGISKLKISGIRTEQCCETTTRVASDLGYQVDFVLDATLTFAMQDPFDQHTVTLSKSKRIRLWCSKTALPRLLLWMTMPKPKRSIYFLVLPGVHLLDLAGPAQIFGHEFLQEAVELHYISTDSQALSHQGLALAQLEPLPEQLAKSSWLRAVGYLSSARVRQFSICTQTIIKLRVHG